jgi:hypothetical protein
MVQTSIRFTRSVIMFTMNTSKTGSAYTVVTIERGIVASTVVLTWLTHGAWMVRNITIGTNV